MSESSPKIYGYNFTLHIGEAPPTEWRARIVDSGNNGSLIRFSRASAMEFEQSPILPETMIPPDIEIWPEIERRLILAGYHPKDLAPILEPIANDPPGQ